MTYDICIRLERLGLLIDRRTMRFALRARASNTFYVDHSSLHNRSSEMIEIIVAAAEYRAA